MGQNKRISLILLIFAVIYTILLITKISLVGEDRKTGKPPAVVGTEKTTTSSPVGEQTEPDKKLIPNSQKKTASNLDKNPDPAKELPILTKEEARLYHRLLARLEEWQRDDQLNAEAEQEKETNNTTSLVPEQIRKQLENIRIVRTKIARGEMPVPYLGKIGGFHSHKTVFTRGGKKTHPRKKPHSFVLKIGSEGLVRLSFGEKGWLEFSPGSRARVYRDYYKVRKIRLFKGQVNGRVDLPYFKMEGNHSRVYLGPGEFRYRTEAEADLLEMGAGVSLVAAGKSEKEARPGTRWRIPAGKIPRPEMEGAEENTP